jgi:hypothetical protein
MAFETGSPGRAAAIIVIGIVLAGFCGQLIRIAQRKWADSHVAAATAGTRVSRETRTENFATQNHLITLHYPADFAAKVIDGDTLVLSRNLPDGETDVLHFMALADPISNDNNEFTRVAGQVESKKPSDWEYREVSKGKATCNGMPGLEIVSTWKPPGSNMRSRRWWCAFLRNGHGYAFSYNTPGNVPDAHEALLRSIVGATTFESGDAGQ